MMNRKTLIGLGLTAAVAVIAALLIQNSRQPETDLEAKAGKLADGLQAEVNAVTELKLTKAGKTLAVSLSKGENGWGVVERDGYPVDTGKLRSYLLRIADANLIEKKTAKPERYADLGLVDIADAKASGVEVRLEGLAKPFAFLAGVYNTKGSGTYVRREGETQTWLASGNLVPEQNPVDWLQKDLMNIPSARIAEVTLTSAEGKVLHVHKQAAAESNYTVDQVPKGRELSSEFAANGLALVLADLRIDDVAASAKVPVGAKPAKARYASFDGLVIEASTWTVDGKSYVSFSASLDAARAEAHAAAEVAAAAAKAGADSEPTDAKEAEVKDVKSDATASSTDASKDSDAAAKPDAPTQAERVATIKAEVDTLNRAFQGWSFVLPSYKQSLLTQTMDGLLKPVDKAGKP